MDEIPAAATAFPHRKGNLFKVQYYAIWNEDNLGFMRELYNVAESVGGNSSGETNSVAKYEIYGSKFFFLGNLKRLMGFFFWV